MKTRRYGFKLKLWGSGRYTLIHCDGSTVEGEVTVTRGINYPIAIGDNTYTLDGRIRAGYDSAKDLLLIHK